MDEPRLARRAEIENLAQLLSEVFGFDDRYDRSRFVSALRRPVHRRGSLIMAEEGRPVSHILTATDRIIVHGCSVKVASIGGVCTHPDYRQRGYAGRILEKSLGLVAAQGARVLIVSGNRSLYQRNHCVPAGQMLQVKVLRESVASASPGSGDLSARRLPADDWVSLSPLHSVEPVRFVRTADFFATRCAWGDISAPESWLITSRGEAVAYLSLTHAWDDREPARRVAFEYAGSRAAILGALPAIFRQAEISEIRFGLLADDREFAYLLADRSIPLTPSTLPGTHRLLDLPGLMRDLRPYLAARLPRAVTRRLAFGQEGQRCTFSLGSETAEMDLSDGIRLVLGGPDAPCIEGELGRVLAAVLPIPFPAPGFNFV